ncbi:hypothetical protein HLB44_07395 [Aquincola sp. S2]|uniref:Tetratricopeptide repeat protein n=1 Tax=Pseudaquabacterium terrae TaxID=2732868 RepID=A0ABX2EDW6_9BURK|nr:hypothetical protein [Aquabacterium terrae]NRF66803.1 hypothetical protein [Aquabacterium terrae]
MSALGAAHAAEAPPSVVRPNEPATVCALLAPSPWPATTVERRLHLRRLESAQDQCIGHAGFLAVLGALWLDEGDAETARVWLERSLLLEPDNLGALADHALALAALGEPAALKELASSWRSRSDVPPALLRRIESAAGAGTAFRLARARLGENMDWPRFAARGEASVLFGHDSNLAVSPRLTELTLTPPEGGDVVLPVISTPRRGAAVRADLSWQAAWELSPNRMVRTGLNFAARNAPSESSTDWYQAQAAASFTQRWNGWSASVQTDLSWFGGALTEPYALGRARLVLEQLGESCSHAAQFETDGRRQRDTRSADSTTVLLAWRLQCRPLGRRDWQWSLALRGGTDRPNHDGRPGGVQRSLGGVLRLEHRPDPLTTIDLSIGTLRLDDREGYSTLLENNAVRHQAQSFVSMEVSRALHTSWLPGAEWVVQLGRHRQSSNLALFRHEGTTAYTGLRWPW